MSVIIKFPQKLIPKLDFIFTHLREQASEVNNGGEEKSRPKGVDHEVEIEKDLQEQSRQTSSTRTTQLFDRFQKDGIILLTKGADSSMIQIGSSEQPEEERL